MTIPGDDRRVAVIIEDDADIRHLLETVLTQAGFEAIGTSNGLDGVEAVRAYDPVITTLDVSMPGMDGFETAKRIRGFSSTYLIMLTARDEEIDTLMGLDAGADDYLTKPFRPRELRARIDAMLRRPRFTTDAAQLEGAHAPVTGGQGVLAADRAAERGIVPAATGLDAAAASPLLAAGSAGRPTAGPAATAPDAAVSTARPAAGPAAAGAASAWDDWLQHNGLRLNTAMRLVTVDDRPLELTRTEFDLLSALLESNRRVRSKADLALLLRGESYADSYYVNEADKRAVEVHMGNLRRKLGDSPPDPRWIETVRGVGYRLAAARA
jgi:two-component system OmpR family response regulator